MTAINLAEFGVEFYALGLQAEALNTPTSVEIKAVEMVPLVQLMADI